jgi:hypothetical protein
MVVGGDRLGAAMRVVDAQHSWIAARFERREGRDAEACPLLDH